jgi:hypothetical protein
MGTYFLPEILEGTAQAEQTNAGVGSTHTEAVSIRSCHCDMGDTRITD